MAYKCYNCTWWAEQRVEFTDGSYQLLCEHHFEEVRKADRANFPHHPDAPRWDRAHRLRPDPLTPQMLAQMKVELIEDFWAFH